MADSSIAATGLPILETDASARKSAETAHNYAVTSLVLTMPISMEGAILRSEESPVEQLDRAAYVHKHFIQPSHTAGPNFHNVSLTVNYKAQKAEEESILAWLLTHTDCYAGVSMFPEMETETEDVVRNAERENGKTDKKRKLKSAPYPQMPFEEVDEETYKEWMAAWNNLGLMAREQMLKDLLHDKNSVSAAGGAGEESVVVSSSSGGKTMTSSPEKRKWKEEEEDVQEKEREEEDRRILDGVPDEQPFLGDII